MAFTATIPQASDDPSQSQPLILANFTEIATAFNTNHGDFNSGDQGLHTFLQMPEQSSAPTTANNVGALYTKEVSGTTQLFWREESDGTEYQMTGQQSLSGGQGSITFPGGLTMKYGTTTGGSAVAFTSAFSSAVYSVVISFRDPAGSVGSAGASSVTVNGFTAANFDGSGVTMNWIAIGM